MVSTYCIVLFRHKWYIVVQALQLWVLMTWAELQVLLPLLETHSNGLHASGAYNARLQRQDTDSQASEEGGFSAQAN